jgi:hypothetical protein
MIVSKQSSSDHANAGHQRDPYVCNNSARCVLLHGPWHMHAASHPTYAVLPCQRCTCGLMPRHIQSIPDLYRDNICGAMMVYACTRQPHC